MQTAAGREKERVHFDRWPGGRRLLAEVIGTFALTLVAAGADTAGRLTGGEVSALARAAAPALLVMALIYAIGDASGAHFNPAVSLAFTLKRLFPSRWLFPYWVAQLAGALLAGIGLRLVFGDAAAAGVSTPHVPAAVALIIETVLTCVLVIVILGTADRHQVVGPNAALAVGATIALCGFIALPVSGLSMNPARSLGPAVGSADLANLWIYWAGPFLGAAIAVVVTTLIHGPERRDEGSREAAQGSRHEHP